jgi:hypothetical protein
MTDPFQFRIATVSDAGAISRLILEMAASVTAANLNSERFRYHLAWEGGVLAGVIGIRDGTRLWQLGREAALAAGNPGHFTVNATPAARPLYERFGFRACGEPIEHNGVRARPMEWRGGQEGEGETSRHPYKPDRGNGAATAKNERTNQWRGPKR